MCRVVSTAIITCLGHPRHQADHFSLYRVCTWVGGCVCVCTRVFAGEDSLCETGAVSLCLLGLGVYIM